jgi:N-acetylated-alpha-linked acidic dipeptidase
MADSERTPLLAVVQTRPARDRYPHHTLRCICTLVLSAVLLLGISAVTLVLAFLPLDEADEAAGSWRVYLPGVAHEPPSSWPNSAGISYEDLQELLMTVPNAERAREWSQYYTSGPHLAGKNLSQAVWTKERWQEFGVENTYIVDYDIYVNYPKEHRLALLEKGDAIAMASADEDSSEDKDIWKIKFEASLEEDVLEDDSTSGLADRIPTFHGYSASGNVTAPYVYVNYGTYADFEELRARNISLLGKIALIKYGNVFRGLKVKRAQELGMVGAVIYTDPGDDGDVTEENGYKTYPDGPARNPSSVQRGSCQFLSK